ncbi:class I SAM-dependent methyltransferase [Paraburkholderia unamae]|uniref:Class I SAM-dependent methyltransferase n=1 Tax=Paraburkholderia unamae TaxID=219649 RepID=A0ACC6REN8_9BURK
MEEAIVGAFERVLMRAFGRPEGILGRLGGTVMARMNQPCAAWAIGLLGIREHDRVLEIGFGPGAAIQLLAAAAPSGHVDGIDPSQEMLAQATARNAAAIARGRVGLRTGSVERLPFEDNTFDKVLAINSMQVWPVPFGLLNGAKRTARRSTPSRGETACSPIARPGQTKSAYDPPKNTGFIPVGLAGWPICEEPFIAGP